MPAVETSASCPLCPRSTTVTLAPGRPVGDRQARIGAWPVGAVTGVERVAPATTTATPPSVGADPVDTASGRRVAGRGNVDSLSL